MSDNINKIELIVEEFEDKLFEEINQLQKKIEPASKEGINNPKVKMTLLVDKLDRKRLKIIAASKNTTVTDIIYAYIKEYIKSNWV